jgi:hypothetical protein
MADAVLGCHDSVMKGHRLPAATIAAALLLLTGACGADGDQGGTASSSTEPKSELIVYSEKPEESVGVTIEKVADVDKLKGAPDDFKQFIAGMFAAWTGMFIDKDCPFSVGVAKIDTSGFAVGSMFTCGGAAFIWSKRDGLWQEVIGGQDVFPCEVLKKHSVPKSIVPDGKCFDGKDAVDYTG